MSLTTKSIWALALAATLAGCASGESSNSAVRLGSDGSFHPDATAGLAAFTGQGPDAVGWAGDSNGESGPSAELPAADDTVPR